MEKTGRDTVEMAKARRAEGQATLDDAKTRVPRNVVSNWISFIANTAVAFLISPVIVHSLGTTEYGIWALIGDFVGYSWLLGFGVGYAVVRYVAGYHAQGMKEKLNALVTTSLVISLLSSVVVMMLGGGFAYFFPHLFSIPASSIHAARWTVILVASIAAGGFPSSVFNGCLAAASRYDQLAVRNVVPNVLRALLLWGFLHYGYGLLAVALISAGSNFLSYFLDYWFTKRDFPELEIRIKHFERGMLRTLAAFSGYALILAISARLIFMTDNLVVGFVLGPVAVAYYSVGLRLPDMLRDSLGNVTKLFFSFASQMDALGHSDGLQRLYLAGSRIASLCVFAGVAGLMLLGPPFLDLWMGRPFGDRSGPIMAVLAGEVGLFGLSSTCTQVLYGMNRHRVNAWVSAGNAGVNLVLSTILIRWLGAVGVAWGTLIPAIAAEGIILPIFTGRVLRLPIHRFYINGVVRPFIAVVPFAAWLWLCRTRGFANGYFSLIVITSLGLLLYFMMAWIVSLDEEEKATARGWFQRWRVATFPRRPTA